MIKKDIWKWLVLFLSVLLATLLFVLFVCPHGTNRLNNWALVNLETGEIFPFEEHASVGRAGVGGPGKIRGTGSDLTYITIKNQGGGLLFLGEMSRDLELITGNLFMQEEQGNLALLNQRDGSLYPLSGNGFSIWTADYYLSFFRQAVKASGREKIRYGLSIFY